MFLIKKGAALLCSDIASLHAKNLIGEIPNYNGRGMPYESGSIIRRIERVKEASNGKCLRFFKDLSNNQYQLLRRILSGNPNDLNRIAGEFKRKIDEKVYPEIKYRSAKGKPLLFGDKLNSVFNYDSFISKEKVGWNAYELAKALGVNVCSYCNRNYTHTVTKGRDYYVRPEFDHFLPKYKFPFLAISFYNLIPSCHTCNSNLKLKVDFNTRSYLHPYLSSFDDIAKFSVEFVDKKRLTADQIAAQYGAMFFQGKVDGFEIKLKKKRKSVSNYLFSKVQRNAEVFKLPELYNCHKDMVSEMVLNAVIYNEDKIKELLTAYPNLFDSRADVMRHISKNYPSVDDMSRRPFSKLTKDIHIELGFKY